MNRRIASSRHFAWVIFSTLTGLSLIYRARLYCALSTSDASSPLYIASACANDAAVSVSAALMVWTALALARLCPFPRLAAALRRAAVAGGIAFSLLAGLHYACAFKVVTTMGTPITKALLSWVGEGFSLAELLSYADGKDAVFALIAGPLLVAGRILDRFAWARNHFLVLTALLPALVRAYAGHSPQFRAYESQMARYYKDFDRFDWNSSEWRAVKAPPAKAMSANPLLYTISDILSRRAGRLSSMEHSPSGDQLLSPAFIDSLWTEGSGEAPKSPPDSHPKAWNIVVLIIESGGTKYMLDPDKRTMPFLARLKTRALFAANHFTSAAWTPPAVFSILTGLYPGTDFTISRKDISIPSLLSFLGPRYDSFVVISSMIDAWFPGNLLRNTGLKRAHDVRSLPLKTMPSLFLSYNKDEMETCDFFIKQALDARKPFLGIYHVYAPHFPYRDYGDQYRVEHDTGSALNRYLNNLYLADKVIERVYAKLESAALLDDTIVVVVGDHGEMFGKTAAETIHGTHVSNEVQQTPLLIWQPRLIGPMTTTYPTSHVDVLPTLLSLLRIDHDPRLLQGESLFSGGPRRKYVFVTNVAGDLSAISRGGIKMVFRYAQDHCTAFDLAADPKEAAPLDCERYPEQMEAMLQFPLFQNHVLKTHQDGGYGKHPAGRKGGAA